MSTTVEITLETILENRRLWAEALRSGEYRQVTGMMYDNVGGYCCLGVGRALVAPPLNGLWGGFADSKTRERLGLVGDGGKTAVMDELGRQLNLDELNDFYELTFAEIADLIDDGQVLLNVRAGAFA